ncbi:MAG: hypothetical protein GKR89_20580 [Candidatus Latescibacteria bacterium]|nr:hypothetical protein [Candidatus Latescibacterota bacterium]
MMTPQQRYLFDVTGYLHLPNALSPDELERGRRATQRYLDTPPDQLPPGFAIDGKRHLHGFAFDKALEALVFHPSTWPIVKELTNDKPRFVSGTLQVDRPGEVPAGRLHCAREDLGWQSVNHQCRDGRVHCDNFAVFPYFDDVGPGEGGLGCIPGSHKTLIECPDELFNGGIVTDPPPPGTVRIEPKAGDIVVISEGLVHSTLQWKPTDRIRRILVLRYATQYTGYTRGPEPAIAERLAPQTLELMAPAGITHSKEIAQCDLVTLSNREGSQP